MASVTHQRLHENLSLSTTAFFLYAPISVLAVPVTVLAINPAASFILLTCAGLALTAIIFLCYLPFIWLDQRITPARSRLRYLNFFISAIAIGALRGFLFYQMVQSFGLKAPGDLLNRVLASITTTLFWLCTASILVNFARAFRARYQKSLNVFIQRNLGAIPALIPSVQSTAELEKLQTELSKSLAHRLEIGDAKNLREVAQLLESQINSQLRPLSRRIWLRSLNEFPVIRFRQLLKDCTQHLDFSKKIFLFILLFLALLNNVFIRSLAESVVRTSTFFAILLCVMALSKVKIFEKRSVYLIAIGIIPVIGSEFIVRSLGYSGSWTATLLISLVAPALMIVLSLFNLTLRDHELIIELLENYQIDKNFKTAVGFDPGERQLASYLHNSLQSELLSIAGQLEEAAVSNDHEKSAEILQRVSSLINRSFIDDFQKFSESPLERLDKVCKSWNGILDIELQIPESCLKSPERNAILVQTIEEFASNSYRHGNATKVSALAHEDSSGLHLTLQSNGSGKFSTSRGLGTQWLDQVAREPWILKKSRVGTTLQLTI